MKQSIFKPANKESPLQADMAWRGCSFKIKFNQKYLTNPYITVKQEESIWKKD